MHGNLETAGGAGNRLTRRNPGRFRLTACASCLLVMAAVAMGCSSSKEPTVATDLDGAQVRIYEVFGMDCPGCHGAVEKIVTKVAGVADASANWKEQRLTVTVHDGADPADDEIFAAIKRANFTPGKRLQ